MPQYFIRSIHKDDYPNVSDIYRDNHGFLLHHLGMTCVDESFIASEVLQMKKVGFQSCVIVDRESLLVKGILDFKEDKEVYLSLLILAVDLQGKGVGRDVYSLFESEMIQRGHTSIRIDVVNDYQGNVIPFWRKLGFAEGETIRLSWGNKSSQAVVMRKDIRCQVCISEK